jgi:hypothetical protein
MDETTGTPRALIALSAEETVGALRALSGTAWAYSAEGRAVAEALREALRVLASGGDDVATLSAMISDACEAHEDFEYRAEIHADYTDADVASAREWHAREVALAQRLGAQQYL